LKKIWPFMFYFWQYAAVACMMPFLVLYYQDLGFSGKQIGFLTGLYPLITLFSTPIWSGIADYTRSHRMLMSISLFGGSLLVFVLPFSRNFSSVLFFISFISIFLAPISSLADSATMWMLADEKDKYGRMRLGGTIGFAIAAYLAGQFVQTYGLKVVFLGAGLMYFLAFLTSQKFSHNSEKDQTEKKIQLTHSIQEFLGNTRLILFLIGALTGGFALAGSTSYFFPYMKALGADASAMGLALTLGTVCEVPVLFFGNWLLKYFRAYPLFIISLVVSGVRLILFSIAGDPFQATLIQLLNGFTFPILWMAGVSYVNENAPAGLSATAQGIFGATVFGLGTALGGFFGGNLLVSIGARGLCLTFGVVTLAIVAFIFFAGKLLPSNQSLPVMGK